MQADSQVADGRARQRARTRRLILVAALDLMEKGVVPTVEQAAEAADMSPATGYRYFPTQATLLQDAVEASFPDWSPDELFANKSGLARIDLLIDEGFPNLVKHEVLDRAVLRLAMDQWLRQKAGQELREAPVQRFGRKPLVGSVVAPLRHRLNDEQLERLEAALGMVLGIESYVALSDVYGLEPAEIAEVWRWACKAMVKAATSQARATTRRKPLSKRKLPPPR